jgi:predicted RNase H-like HicB family nuclease
MKIEIEQEDDGRWIAEVIEVPGAMAYGATPEEAIMRALDIARKVEKDERF